MKFNGIKMLISTFWGNRYIYGGYPQSYALGYTVDINVVIHEVINNNKKDMITS